MDTTTLLRKLAQRGVTLQVVGDRLRWQGPKGAMTPALRAALVDNKAEVRRRLGPQRPAKRGDLAGGPGGGDSASSAGGGICHQGGDPLPVQDLEALLAELGRLETSADRTDDRIDALMARWVRLSPPPSGDNAGDVASSRCHHTTAQGCKIDEGGNGAGSLTNFHEGGNGRCTSGDFDIGGNGVGGDNAGDQVASTCHHTGENSENARRGTGGIPAHTGTDTAALERLARERWPGDPPPVTPCGWFGTHRQFWRHPQGGEWLCAICHPAPPGVQVETWAIPIEAGGTKMQQEVRQ